MRQRTRIKFCGLVRAEDVRTAVALGVDAVGLVFYPRSSRFVSIDDAMALRRLLPSWVSAVGLFVDAAPAHVRDHVSRLGLDVVQFHGNESPADCLASLPANHEMRLAWWRAVRMREAGDLLTSLDAFGAAHTDAAVAGAAESFVVDAWSPGYGGSGESFDWSLVPRQRDWSLILSGGLHAGNVGDGIARLAPVAVDVSTGIQGESPRMKEASAMEAFVAAVAGADAMANERTK